MNNNHKFGFTLIELLIVFALITIFSFLTIPFGINFYGEQVLNENASTLANNLKIAQSHATAGKNNSSWGIKLNHVEGEYIFFQGESYIGRNPAYDQVFTLSSGVITEGITEIVFKKGTGDPYITTE